MALRVDHGSGGVHVPEGVCVLDRQADPAFRQQTHGAGRNGTSAFTVVPRHGLLLNSNVPRSCSTRSRILITPSPPDLLSTSGVQPTPSSDTERQTVPLDRVSRTSTLLASEYLAALPSCRSSKCHSPEESTGSTWVHSGERCRSR
jgi:hypothetical protein